MSWRRRSRDKETIGERAGVWTTREDRAVQVSTKMPIKWSSIIDEYFVVSTISIPVYAYVLYVIITSNLEAVQSHFSTSSL
ncbi:hypothetical protein KIN20_003521 [Parelaphostrongylus tenuis]|uniref:Uncharacterized protein n=1 Tax=Parelaphostrongylus tenuis TaxID=148309 RepID=A0AAD5M0B9_PARTN|nr:hypothetical protein KIN20_003521 [Parelaphostrongylus tenuis]